MTTMRDVVQVLPALGMIWGHRIISLAMSTAISRQKSSTPMTLFELTHVLVQTVRSVALCSHLRDRFFSSGLEGPINRQADNVANWLHVPLRSVLHCQVFLNLLTQKHLIRSRRGGRMYDFFFFRTTAWEWGRAAIKVIIFKVSILR